MLYPTWLNPGDNAWQMTAATLVGLMSVSRASSYCTAGSCRSAGR